MSDFASAGRCQLAALKCRSCFLLASLSIASALHVGTDDLLSFSSRGAFTRMRSRRVERILTPDAITSPSFAGLNECCLNTPISWIWPQRSETENIADPEACQTPCRTLVTRLSMYSGYYLPRHVSKDAAQRDRLMH